MTIRDLAKRVAYIADIMIPWEFSDVYRDMEEAIECISSELETDPELHFSALEDFEEMLDDDDPIARQIASIRADVADLVIAKRERRTA